MRLKEIKETRVYETRSLNRAVWSKLVSSAVFPFLPHRYVHTKCHVLWYPQWSDRWLKKRWELGIGGGEDRGGWGGEEATAAIC